MTSLFYHGEVHRLGITFLAELNSIYQRSQSQHEVLLSKRIVNIKLLGKAALNSTNYKYTLFLLNSWEILQPKKANSCKNPLILKSIQSKPLDRIIIQNFYKNFSNLTLNFGSVRTSVGLMGKFFHSSLVG